MDEARSFEHLGHRLVFEEHGEGERVVVLLHGVLLDAGLNRALGQSLAARGNRAVLLELLGHGRSDHPRHASSHRMDSYALQVVALLDHLGVDEAVVGGTSLGANVSLTVAASAPQRVRGMVIEMPVLEWAAPAAAAVFLPLLLGVHYARPIARLITSTVARLPRTGIGVADSFLSAFSTHPDEVAAVVHGLLVGPLAPSIEARRAIEAPTLIIGHERDVLHPFSDARNLAGQLANAHMIQARSVLELRTQPTRLTGTIAEFLDDVWRPRAARSSFEETAPPAPG